MILKLLCDVTLWPLQVMMCFLQLVLRHTITHCYAGFTLQGTKAPKLVAPKGAKSVTANRSSSRENTSLLVAINAAGGYTAPMIVFKAAQRVSADWIAGVPVDWRVSRTESSMMNTDVFFEWVQHFCTELPTGGGKHVLFLDGHVSHISLETVEYADEHNVLIFQLPSHASHMVQPLDLVAFGVMKAQYMAMLNRFQPEHGRYPVKADMGKLIHAALVKALTPTNIVSSFAAAGLVPFSPQRVINRLKGEQGKNKFTHSAEQIPLLDLPQVLQDVTNTANALGARQVRSLAAQGHSAEAVRATTLMLSHVLCPPARDAVKRKRAGLTLGGVLTVAQLREQEAEAVAAAEEKAERAAERAARAAAGGRGGRGGTRGGARGRGRGRGAGRSGGRGA